MTHKLCINKYLPELCTNFPRERSESLSYLAAGTHHIHIPHTHTLTHTHTHRYCGWAGGQWIGATVPPELEGDEKSSKKTKTASKGRVDGTHSPCPANTLHHPSSSTTNNASTTCKTTTENRLEEKAGSRTGRSAASWASANIQRPETSGSIMEPDERLSTEHVENSNNRWRFCMKQLFFCNTQMNNVSDCSLSHSLCITSWLCMSKHSKLIIKTRMLALSMAIKPSQHTHEP